MSLDLEQIKARREAAHAELSALCKGKRWQMSIPAQMDYDSDLLIGAALRDIPALIEEVERLRRELEESAISYELLDLAAHNFHTLATFPKYAAGDCRLCNYRLHIDEGHAADCPYAQADTALREVLQVRCPAPE